jgi:hypothetical protein
VLYGYEKVASLAETDTEIRRAIMDIKASLYETRLPLMYRQGPSISGSAAAVEERVPAQTIPKAIQNREGRQFRRHMAGSSWLNIVIGGDAGE